MKVWERSAWTKWKKCSTTILNKNKSKEEKWNVPARRSLKCLRVSLMGRPPVHSLLQRPRVAPAPASLARGRLLLRWLVFKSLNATHRLPRLTGSLLWTTIRRRARGGQFVNTWLRQCTPPPTTATAHAGPTQQGVQRRGRLRPLRLARDAPPPPRAAAAPAPRPQAAPAGRWRPPGVLRRGRGRPVAAGDPDGGAV